MINNTFCSFWINGFSFRSWFTVSRYKFKTENMLILCWLKTFSAYLKINQLEEV